MSSASKPHRITSDDEVEIKSPNTAPSSTPSEHSTNHSPKPVTSPEPSKPEDSPTPTVSTASKSQTKVSTSSLRHRLHAIGAKTKRTARMKTGLPMHRVEEIKRWGWVRGTLDRWRTEEGLERVMELGEPSTISPNMPITREPIERTIPPVVVRMDSHDRILREWQMRHGQMEGYMRERLEPKVTTIETRAIKNEQDLAVVQATIDMLEVENAQLRSDLEESKETVTAMEEYIDLLEQRVEVIEDGYARNERVTDALNRMIQALTQVQPPPPPPPQ